MNKKHRNYLIILTFLFVLLQQKGIASPWSLISDIEPKKITELKENYPEIHNAQDLDNLLKDLAHSHRFVQLEAYFKNSSWIIVGRSAHIVKEIKLDLITGSLKNVLDPIVQKYIGNIDSSILRQKILDEILETMNNAGYISPELKLILQKENDLIYYTVSIHEYSLCRIKEIHIPFKLPAGINFEIEPGDLCNHRKITNAVEELQDKLKKNGYYNSSLELQKIENSQDESSADIFLVGKLGKKIKYVVSDSELGFFEGLFFSPLREVDPSHFDIDTIKSEIQKSYAEKGYEDVIVKGPYKKETGDLIEHEFRVNHGIKYTISTIQIEGNQEISQEKIKSILDLESYFGWNLVLNKEKIFEATDTLRYYYQTQGFWDVKIWSPTFVKNSFTQEAEVFIKIVEGKKTVLGAITLDGNHFFSTEELLNKFPVKQDEALDRNIVLELEDNIKKRYVEAGYLYVALKTSVRFEEKDHQTKVYVHFFIQENLRVKIVGISIVGLVKTHEKVVLRELNFKEGDWYGPLLANKSRDALVKLGIFSTVQLTLEEIPSNFKEFKVINILIEAREGDTGKIAFGPGYDLYRGFHYDGELNYKNIWGWGRQASIKAGFSQEKNQTYIQEKDPLYSQIFLGKKLGAGFLEPYIFDLPINGNVSIAYSSSADIIRKTNYIFESALTHQFKNLFPYTSSISTFYNFTLNLDEGSSAQEQSLIATGRSEIGSIGIRYLLDTRDNSLWTTKGMVLNASVQIASPLLKGDFSFIKYQLANNYFFNVYRQLVFAFGFSLTSYENVIREKDPDNLGVLPSSERLKATGSEKIRGFVAPLGPYVTNENKDTLGGSRRITLKGELRQKIYKDILGLSIFIDSGNVFLSKEELLKYDKRLNSGESIKDNYYYSYKDLLKNPSYLYTKHYLSTGLALKILSPIGSINLGLAWPLHEPQSEDCNNCYKRASYKNPWIRKFQVELTVGSDF